MTNMHLPQGSPVLVLGASGVAGGSSVAALSAAGLRVAAHVRSVAAAHRVAALGGEPVFADLEDDEALRLCMTGMEAVVDLRSAVPHGNRALRDRAWREYEHLRGDEMGRVVDAALETGVEAVLRDTVTVVYTDGGDAMLTEEAPTSAPGALSANLGAEAHLERFSVNGGRGIALRMAPFYGAEDVISAELLRAAEQGEARVFGHPEGWTSALHSVDVGPAVLAALAVPAGIYNVADSTPLRRRDWVGLLASSVGRRTLRQPPTFLRHLISAPVAALTRSHRVSADHFTATSGWRPTVPDRRIGWPVAATRLRGALP